MSARKNFTNELYCLATVANNAPILTQTKKNSQKFKYEVKTNLEDASSSGSTTGKLEN
jgi:hypothetical protein